MLKIINLKRENYYLSFIEKKNEKVKINFLKIFR
jgi:hypothetical protein